MFTSVQAIQVAGAEDRVIGQFRELNDTRRKSMLKDKLFSQALDSVFSNTVNLGTGFILILAGQKMQNGTFQVGDFALFVYYLNFVTTFIQNFGKFLTYYKQSTVSSERMGALLQGASEEKLIRKAPLYLRGELPAPAEIASEAVPTTVLKGSAADAGLTLDELKVTGLTYMYPVTGRGIREIDFTLQKGSFTVVTGRIGSGKTTLVRALLGLLPPGGGQVLWNGRQVEDPGNFFVPPVSAYTPQVPRLYSDTLTENILLGLPNEGGRLQEAVHAAVLEHDVEELHLGLDTVIGPRGVKLSGGQAQRTAAARMFAREAELYVFDDLSSALDVETEQKLWERLFAGRKAACLVVSHRKAVLQHADRILLLKDGRLHASGTLAELLDTNEEMRRLWSGEIS